MLITCLHEKLGFHLGKCVYPALVAIGKNPTNLKMWLYFYPKNRENLSTAFESDFKVILMFAINYTDAVMCTM